MAESCLGVPGTFQYSAPRCKTTSDADPKARCEEKGGKPDELEDICPKCNDEIVWIHKKRYDPADPRFDAPVPRYKIVARDPETVCVERPELVDAAGKPCTRPSARSWMRTDQKKGNFVSQHHTRCEQWSTLHEMMPSIGRADPKKQPNWGTGRAVPPSLVGTRAVRFPVYDSEMTRSGHLLAPQSETFSRSSIEAEKFVNMAHAIDPQFSLF